MSEKFKPFEDENDFRNKKIELNSNSNQNNQVHSPEKKDPKFLANMKAHKDDVAAGMFARSNSNSTEEISNGVLKNVNTKIAFIGKYFDVEVEEIQEKLIAAVTPLNRNFYLLAEKNSDLYGPFWIYTTLIFVVVMTGNLSNYINAEDKNTFRYNFNFIPNAALFVY